MSSFVQDWKCSKCKSDNAFYEDFKDYTTYLNPSDSLVDSVDIDYKQVLNDYGFNNGKYKSK